MPYSCANTTADANSAGLFEAWAPTILSKQLINRSYMKWGSVYLHIKLKVGIKNVNPLGCDVLETIRLNLLDGIVGPDDR